MAFWHKDQEEASRPHAVKWAAEELKATETGGADKCGGGETREERRRLQTAVSIAAVEESKGE